MSSETEWRRRWKPDFKAQGWKSVIVARISPSTLSVDSETFLLKTHITENSYELLITDTLSLWFEQLGSEDVKKRTKKLNPSVEAPVSKILDHIRDSLEDTDAKRKGTKLSAALKNQAVSDEQKMLLTLSTKLAGLPFVWKFSAMPADSKMVSDHLTVPLLTMVGELNRRQGELYKLLKNKDKEIEDLKAQGVRVSRKHLETGSFDETIFQHSMSVAKGFDQQVREKGLTAFNKDNQELYRDVTRKLAYVNRSADDVMEEGDTFAGDSAVVASGTSAPSWSNRLPPSIASGSVSPRKSPIKSPVKSPVKSASEDDASPVKDTELLRRQALERRLVEEEEKKEQKKKKKKMKF